MPFVYVGMTRARKNFLFFFIKERHEKQLEPSRFLKECGWQEEKDGATSN